MVVVRLLRVCAALCRSSVRAELCRTMPLPGEPLPLGAAGKGAEPGGTVFVGCKMSALCEV